MQVSKLCLLYMSVLNHASLETREIPRSVEREQIRSTSRLELEHNFSHVLSECLLYVNSKVFKKSYFTKYLLDSMGNYLYCHDCSRKAIHVSKQRLARQRRIKRKMFQQQEVMMTKKEVDEKKLGQWKVAGLSKSHTLPITQVCHNHNTKARSTQLCKQACKLSYW